MKKRIFTLALLTFCFATYAQTNLRNTIRGEQGISKHFVSLDEKSQKVFNAGSARAALGLDEQSDLVLINKQTDQLALSHYRYYQTFKGIPVENSMYLIHVQNGKITGMSGEIVVDFDKQNNPPAAAALSKQNAIDAALKNVRAQIYMWQDAEMELRLKDQMNDSKATYAPTAKLVWYNAGDNINPRDLKLAYKVDIYAKQPLSRADYFIDAQTGKYLGKKDKLYFTDATGTAATAYSGSQTIHSDFTGSTYRLRDLTKGNGIITLHGESGSRGTDYTSSSANWSLTGTNQAALDAHYGVSQTYSFYLSNFNRNSYDNAGTALTSYVNDPTYTDNAFWDGTAMNFNKRSTGAAGGVTGIDVTGHELTHGVTQTTSNLNYSAEPGAMNESMSDIMGKSVQFWSKPADVNWLISNDMNWIIRDMSNPNAQGQPDTYKGTNWYTGTADNSGVHTNSGVGNYMFYLLVTGGSGTNDIGNSFTVTGLGLSKTDQIIYRTETVYLTSTSKYADWRTASINAATDLYGASSNEVTQVQNAWYAVGIGTAGGGGGTCNTPTGLASSAITSSSATVSWTAVSGATGYNLQYKLSTASTWTTVSNLTTASYGLTGLTASSTYQFQVQTICSSTSTSAYSTAASFTTATSGGITYCTSTGTSTTYEYINKVALGSISNTSGNNSGYGNYTALSTSLTTNTAYTITLTPGFASSSYTEYWTVYIDYNQNGTLNDAGETVATGSGSAALSKSFTVPATALAGATRMRIQMHYGSSSTNPCGTLDYGEVEDYTVNIVTGTATCNPATGLAASAITSSSATVSWAAVSGATGYNLQYKTSAASTFTTVSNLTTTSYNLTGLSASTLYQYQVQTICSGGTTSAYTAASSFTTLSGSITYCASKGTSTSYEYINKVALGTISNTSGNNSGYGNYTALSTNLSAGTSNTITLTPGFVSGSYTEYWTVYIDYNQNGTLNDAGETVATGSGSVAISKAFTVPATSKNGATRMRVQMHYGSSSTNPCATLDYGEVEDYTVNISGGTGLNSIAGISAEDAAIKNANATVTVAPNPVVSTNATVQYHLANGGTTSLRIIDLSGRNLQTIQLGNQNTGEHNYALRNLANLTSGTYIIVLEQKGAIIARNRFVVSR